MTATVQHPMYIDGQFVSWQGNNWIDVVNPATEERLSRIPDGDAEHARLAIDAAERAQPAWEALPAIERAGWLRKIAAGIRARAGNCADDSVRRRQNTAVSGSRGGLHRRLYRVYG